MKQRDYISKTSNDHDQQLYEKWVTAYSNCYRILRVFWNDMT